MNINIPIKADEKGYVDRKCPVEECSFVFKLKESSFENLNTMFCPMCGHQDDSMNSWMTQEQYDQAIEVAKAYALGIFQDHMDKAFKSLANSTRNNKYCKITYKPGKRISYDNMPITQTEEWELDIKCSNCNTEYSVVGNAYFCPKCGNNNILDNIEESLLIIKRVLDSNDKLFDMFSKLYGKDHATICCREILENSLGDIVSNFQSFAYEIFKRKRPEVKVRVNDFQIVDVGNKLFNNNFGIKYTDFITDAEYNEMNIYFQKRHIIEHLNGIVDEMYLEKTNDTNYKVGQRIIIRKSDIENLLKIITKLCNSLKKTIFME